jgi:hypothetical protein
MDLDGTKRLHDDKATSKTQGNPRTDSAQTAANRSDGLTNSNNNDLKFEHVGLPLDNEQAQLSERKASNTYCRKVGTIFAAEGTAAHCEGQSHLDEAKQ